MNGLGADEAVVCPISQVRRKSIMAVLLRQWLFAHSHIKRGISACSGDSALCRLGQGHKAPAMSAFNRVKNI